MEPTSLVLLITLLRRFLDLAELLPKVRLGTQSLGNHYDFQILRKEVISKFRLRAIIKA